MSSVWLVSEKLISISISIIVTLAVARHLLPEQFGQLNYLISVVSLISPLLALGLNSIISRELLLRPEDNHLIMGSAFVLRALSAVCILPAAIWVASLYLAASQINLFTVLMIFNIFHAAHVVDFWLQANLESRYAAVLRLVSLVVFSAARLAAVKYGAGFSVFVYLAAIEMAFIALLYLFTYERLSGGVRKLQASVKESKRLLRDGRWLIVSGVAAVIYLKIDQVMLGVMLDQRAVGIYAAAARVSEVWYFIPAAIAASFFPRLIKQKKANPAVYRLELQKINDFLFCSGLAIAVLVSLLANWLILLFGEAYIDSVPILVAHIWAGIFVFTRALLSKWLITENLLRLSMLTQVLGAAVNVILNIQLIPLYGPVGAAYATVVSYAVAGYLVLFLHRDLWPMAIVVTKSVLLPVRFIQKGRRLYNAEH